MSKAEDMHGTDTAGDFGKNEFDDVITLVQIYFEGLYQGDVKKLASIFHSDTFLKAPGLRRSLTEWLAAVAERPIPAHQGLAYNFRLLSIEIIKDQAMVKLDCPLFDHAYVDFLSLLKENGRWLVVNKMYTDLNE